VFLRRKAVKLSQSPGTFGRSLTDGLLGTGLGEQEYRPEGCTIKIPRSSRAPSGTRGLQPSQQAAKGKKGQKVVRLQPVQTVATQSLAPLPNS
jgi:hypothetical protein